MGLGYIEPKVLPHTNRNINDTGDDGNEKTEVAENEPLMIYCIFLI